MGRFNELSDAEKETLIRGPLGRELLRAIEACVAPLHWRSRMGAGLPRNGSVLFVKTTTGLFGVTAKHVYDEYKEQADRDSNIVCRIHNLELDLRPRLISRGNQCDLATFEILTSELGQLPTRTVS